MRSLTLKLTLAFLFVGVIGVVTFALLVGLRTRTEFDRYLSARDQAVLVDALRDYYTARGSWDGVNSILDRRSPLSYYSRSAILLDVDQKVVLGNRAHPPGQQMSPGDLNSSTTISVNEQTVGYVLFTPRDDQPGNAPGNSPAPPDEDQLPYAPGAPLEDNLLERVASAALTSAAITALLALLVGGILARTLTRPLGELTAATKAMAAGQLDQRVRVHGRDEIGILAAAFNHMSADLARASQLRKQMTADLAHDLRTPLTILRGYTEGLKEQRLRSTPA
ncbi:MAG: HAMP domain-containing protein, partial [Chloroflexi bacterium]|nr:HAMP domain-containing protein [Chloroflexota bacterium]